MVKELEPELLYLRCDPDQFDFETTAELEDMDGIVGQPRAVAAVAFGVAMKCKGYNIYALGPVGTGRHHVVEHFMRKAAAEAAVPPDSCYVYNFDDPTRPRVLQVPAGTGVRLARDMEQLVDEGRTALGTAFESEEYQRRRQSLEKAVREWNDEAFESLREKAQTKGFAVLRTPAGLVFAPAKDGELVPAEQLKELSEEDRKRIEQVVAELQKELQEILRRVPRLQREHRKKVRQMNQEMVDAAVGPLFEEIKQEYAQLPQVVTFLEAVERNVLEAAHEIAGGQAPAAESADSAPLDPRTFQVNVLVDHGEADGAPVVYEENPTYANLVGRIERHVVEGALVTDFNLIRPGALHRANGGFLLLDARRMLLQPLAWEALKQALETRQIRVESPGELLGVMSTVSIEPEPVPLDVKVVLVGAPLIYYLLNEHDPDFGKLFKVAVDFDDRMARDGDTQMQYARLLGQLARGDGLLPLERGAVARIIEQGARLCGDSERLSARTGELHDLLRESDHLARQEGSPVVSAAHVQRAIDAKIYRSDRIRERIQEEIRRGTFFIDTEGVAVGQVNGLSVLALGNFAFGRPSRITARARMGKGNVVDIEREVKLSGPLHSKGVLILSSFLSGRYAADQPLSLSASLVFEQSYGKIDGDSASSAELYALLSAIAGVGLRQDLAVTGSVSQLGEVQPVGGVNEKIEGFFDTCQARELTGDQGVLIPAANVKHLMLRRDVVEAVAAKRFHIWAVEHIDEGIELLSRMPAGQADGEGKFPEGTFNAKVAARLAELAEKQRKLAAAARGKDNKEEKAKDKEEDEPAEGKEENEKS